MPKKRKKHGKRPQIQNYSAQIPEPDEELIPYFKQAVKDGLRKGLTRKYAIVFTILAVEASFEVYSDPTPERANQYLDLYQWLVEKGYLSDAVIDMVYERLDGECVFFEFVQRMVEAIDNHVASILYAGFPDFAKDNLEALESYVKNLKGFVTVDFQGDVSDITFLSNMPDGEAERELVEKSFHCLLIQSFVAQRCLITVSMHYDGVEHENKFMVQKGNVTAVLANDFDQVDDDFLRYELKKIADDDSDNAKEYTDDSEDEIIDVENDRACDEGGETIREIAPIIFKQGFFSLDEEKIKQYAKEMGVEFVTEEK